MRRIAEAFLGELVFAFVLAAPAPWRLVESIKWFVACQKNRERDAWKFLIYASCFTLAIIGYVVAFERWNRTSFLVATMAFVTSYVGMGFFWRNVTARSGAGVVRYV